MNFSDALILAEQGIAMTRPAYKESFLLLSEGSLLKGSFIGESSFADMKAYQPTQEDICATDWKEYKRVEIDDWEGCSI